MANVEDETDFGSHFLDSMLEVQMTEDDNELDVSKNDPGDELPPIPTFDLQSETLYYKDVLNSIPQPVLTAVPMAQGPPTNVPLVIQPSPVILYPGDGVQTPPTPRVPSSPKAGTKPSSNTNKVESPEKFLLRVFKPEFVKYVFVKAEAPRELSEVGQDEMAYYSSCFEDVSNVQMCRLHCTICDKHLGCGVSIEKKINVHKMLLVLTCKPCFEFYGDGNFPCDKGDNCEIYCRWCGQGGALVCCSYCPRVFCKKCVKRNFGMPFLKSIEKALDWACFCCAQKPLWPHRAICRALVAYIDLKKTDPKALQRDTSSCCKTRRKMKEVLEKSKTLIVPSNLKVNPAAKAADFKDRIQLPPRAAKESLLKSSMPTKTVGIATPKITTKGSGVFSTRSLLTGNNVISGLTSSAPSAFFSPYVTSSPVLHGETLITPPSRFLLQSRTSGTPSGRPIIQQKLVAPSSCPNLVKIALSNQATTMDLSKIPTAKIPHDVQGRILRLCFPDDRVQLIRLVMEGCCSSNNFPMPEFNEKKPSFMEQNLAAAFKVSKMAYEKLMRIREKVKARTKFTEESVYASAVKKLHGTYEKTIDVLNELDKTLTESWEEWKVHSKTPVDVIELSDEETTSIRQNKSNRYANFREKCKELKVSDDSDIEILDDVSDAVNGQTNHKDKSLLRVSRDKICLNDSAVIRKRKKKGRGRRVMKRYKPSLGNGEVHEDPREDPLKINETGTAGDVNANQKAAEPTPKPESKVKKENS